MSKNNGVIATEIDKAEIDKLANKLNGMDCANCLIYDYQTYSLPERITTREEKYKDTVLGIACRTCINCSNHVKNNPQRSLDERFIRKLELELRKRLGSERYEEEIKRMEKEARWYIWGMKEENFQKRR